MVKQLKHSLGIQVWLRRGLGTAVVAAVVVSVMDWDTRFLSQYAFININETEQKLVEQLAAKPAIPMLKVADSTPKAPPLRGAIQWLNSPPLSLDELRGKVVLVDFWTFACINCLHTLPYVKAWDEKYRSQGLVVIGVHSPEFAFEKVVRNVEKAVNDLGIKYPVAIDNDYKIWNSYENQYWPAFYLIDAQGRVRNHHFGEGKYQETEQMIQALLKEARLGTPL
jgi:thiol-disulfide isomerase/thioredoxin